MLLDQVFLYCPTCAHECLAEAPPCPEGHGDACPDRACVECGTALMLDVALFDPSVFGIAAARPASRRAA